MKKEVVKDPIFKKGCDFCDRKIATGNPVFSFIRDKENALKARMCDDCLKELFDFRQKYFEKIF